MGTGIAGGGNFSEQVSCRDFVVAELENEDGLTVFDAVAWADAGVDQELGGSIGRMTERLEVSAEF